MIVSIIFQIGGRDLPSMKRWQFLYLCARTGGQRAVPRVREWRHDMTASLHQRPAAVQCESDQGRPGSRSCWCQKTEQWVLWGLEECTWWCGWPSCLGCCGCTNSPPDRQQAGICSSWPPWSCHCTSSGKSLSVSWNDKPWEFLDWLSRRPPPNCCWIISPQCTHRVRLDKIFLRFADQIFFGQITIFMDDVHGICGVDTVKMISRTGTNYDTSENIKVLKLDANRE